VYRPEDLGWLDLEISMGQLKATIALNCGLTALLRVADKPGQCALSKQAH